MKESYYFRHDYNARNDELILMVRAEFGTEAYGVFWMILETMAESSSCQINRVAIGGLSLGYGVAKDKLTQIIDYCVKVGLFKESQDGAISSLRMRQHLAFRESLKSAGRAGAEKRWKTSHENRVANGKGKERKENTILVSNDTENFYDWLNQKCGELKITNEVKKAGLEIIVQKYSGKVKMRVEMEGYLLWMLDDGKRILRTAAIRNCLQRKIEFMKKQELKQLEINQAKNDPYLKQRLATSIS